MEQKNQRNSRKRLNSLILLVAFTAVMLIISTYAWFSSQKNVTISNLEGKVNVAEGLMVSLDADRWSQEVDFEDYDSTSSGTATYDKQVNGKYLSEIYADTENDLFIRNIVPSELIPVSTTGFVNSTPAQNTEISAWALGADDATGTGSEELKFFNGINVEGTELYSITEIDRDETVATEVDYPGYFAIDVFLQNSSKIDSDGADNTAGNEDDEVQGQAKEKLQLNTNSLLQLVTGGSELTGLQNTARVALAMYEPDATALADTAAAASTPASVYVTANQSQVLTAYKNAKISQVAIWEPNSDQHVDTIVTTNNKIDITQGGKLDTLYFTADTPNGTTRATFNATDKLPTLGLVAASTTAAESLTDATRTGIKNVYDWRTGTADATNGIIADNGWMKRQISLQTGKNPSGYTTADKGVRDLITTASSGAAIYEMGTESGAVTFDMYKNTVVKLRLYIWLEGQDPDCINHASHGSGVHLDLGLVKGQTPGDGASAS